MPTKRKRIGIFVYCTAEERKTLKTAAKNTKRALSGYILANVMPVAERDSRPKKNSV